jgi:hypothetical protein
MPVRRMASLTCRSQRSASHSCMGALIPAWAQYLAWAHSFLHGCTHSCMGALIPAWAHSFLHGRTHSCMGALPCMGALIPAWVHSFLHGRTHSCMGALIPAWAHSFLHGCTHSCIGALIPAWAHPFLHGRTTVGAVPLQVSEVCATLSGMPELRGGYVAVGFSQGEQLAYPIPSRIPGNTACTSPPHTHHHHHHTHTCTHTHTHTHSLFHTHWWGL